MSEGEHQRQLLVLHRELPKDATVWTVRAETQELSTTYPFVIVPNGSSSYLRIKSPEDVALFRVRVSSDKYKVALDTFQMTDLRWEKIVEKVREIFGNSIKVLFST